MQMEVQRRLHEQLEVCIFFIYPNECITFVRSAVNLLCTKICIIYGVYMLYKQLMQMNTKNDQNGEGIKIFTFKTQSLLYHPVELSMDE